MIHFRDEGELVRNGLNIFPKSSYHRGFVFRLGRFFWEVRKNNLLIPQKWKSRAMIVPFKESRYVG